MKGHCHFENKWAKVDFLAANGTRNIFFEYKNFWGWKRSACRIIINSTVLKIESYLLHPWKEDPIAFIL